MRAHYFAMFAMATVAALAKPAGANLVFSDNFSSYTNGNLVGQGPWVQLTAGTQPVQVSGGAASIAGPASGQYAEAPLGVTINTGSVFYGMDVSLASVNTTSTAYFTSLGSGGSSFQDRVYAQQSGSGYVLGIGVVSQGAVYGTTALNFNQDYRVVTEFDYIGNDDETAELFVDPVDSTNPANDTPYIESADTVGNAGNSAYFDIRQATSGPTGTIDNVDVATDFASAVAAAPVPEPVGAMGLVFLAIGSMRRFRGAAR